MATWNLTRKVLIFLSKDGIMQFASRGTFEHHKYLKLGYLPCASVTTTRHAENLQVAACKLSYDGATYRYPIGKAQMEIDDLRKAGDRIEELYQHFKSNKPGWPDGWQPL